MTKRLVIAALFLSIALTGSLLSYFYIQDTFSEIGELAYKAYYSDESGIDAASKKLIEKWKEKQRAVAVILKHTDADTLEKFFLLLEKFRNSDDEEFLRRTLGELIAFLEVTAEGEKAEIENIF